MLVKSESKGRHGSGTVAFLFVATESVVCYNGTRCLPKQTRNEMKLAEMFRTQIINELNNGCNIIIKINKNISRISNNLKYDNNIKLKYNLCEEVKLFNLREVYDKRYKFHVLMIYFPLINAQ